MGAFSVYFDDGRWQEVRRTVGGCGLSGRKRRVGQENWRRRLVCRDKFVAWVKRPVGGVWSVGTSLLRGSKELATACGLSAQVCCVGQENCRRVWSVGSSMASESRGLSVGVVCRGENVAWVKGTVARVWSVGVKRASEPKKPHISYASNVANCHSDQNCQNPQNMIHLL